MLHVRCEPWGRGARHGKFNSASVLLVATRSRGQHPKSTNVNGLVLSKPQADRENGAERIHVECSVQLLTCNNCMQLLFHILPSRLPVSRHAFLFSRGLCDRPEGRRCSVSPGLLCVKFGCRPEVHYSFMNYSIRPRKVGALLHQVVVTCSHADSHCATLSQVSASARNFAVEGARGRALSFS